MRCLAMLLVVTVMIGVAPGLCATAEPAGGKEGSSATMEKPQSAEDKAIRATAEAFTAAFNKGDAKALAALWAPDGEYVDETGRLTRGRDAIEKLYATIFAENPGLKIEISVSTIRIIGAAAAIEEGSASLKNPEGKLVSKSSYTAIHIKEGDKWLMASVRDYASPTLAERPTFADLEWLIGAWTGQKDSRTVEFTFKWVADKKFMELAYAAKDKGETAASGVQIIGRDPVGGQVTSWSFDSTGGCGQGQWRIMKKGVVVHARGALSDGAPTSATNILSKIDADSFTWQSVNRRVAGQILKDAEPVVMKRK
jgi:uncharacterized protein (TIGR02246 family)